MKHDWYFPLMYAGIALAAVGWLAYFVLVIIRN